MNISACLRPAITSAVTLAVTLAALPASAQDFEADPTYETATLAAGFPEDPHVVSVLSGGDIDASTVGDACAGYIANAPDVRLNYTAGSFPLTFLVTADTDTTLVINGPDGQWYCDDDSGGDLDPAVAFASPQSGQYDIWVGSFEEGATDAATLMITEQAGE